MIGRGVYLLGVCAAALIASGPAAIAADAASAPTGSSATGVSEVVVTADKVGLLEKRPSSTVFGLDKPLIDTPRSASLISAMTIQRYGIVTVDNLVAIAPGTFTASFYGVAGSLNIRGTYAENYFQGFKLIENLGTFTTPIGDAAQIEVVRGPPSPIYGPGRVGGLLNFIPKSAKDSGDYLSGPTGEIDLTGGDYQKKNVTAQFGTPVTLGDIHGGLYAYGEVDDSHSYYRGIYPQHQMGELSGKFDVPGDWTISLDAMYYHSTGDVQTPGWNRLTQALIDNQTYITGRNTALTASPGAGYITPAQTVPGGVGYYPYAVGFDTAYFGYPTAPTATSVLNTGVGTTTLSRRDVYLSAYDFSKTQTPTVYFGLQKGGLPLDGAVKLELFYNGLDNQRFVSYGFPAWLRANVLEARATYDVKFTELNGLISVNNVLGFGDRHSQARDMQSYDSGVIALDRRDISHGATPTDTLCDPFVVGDTGDGDPYTLNCVGWETDIHSKINDAGLFDTADITIGKRLDIIIGGRYDDYNVKSQDSGILADYDAVGVYSASKYLGTYTTSASYKLGWGLMPYVTYAMNSALQYGQAGDIAPDLIPNGGWIRNSELGEAGVKFQFLKGALVGSLDVYRQTRPELDSEGDGFTVVNTVGKGAELEVRYLATRNLSFTFAGNLQHTEVIGPDTSFQYIPAQTVCGANLTCYVNSFGGAYIVYNFSSLPGRSGNYADLPIPHSVDSLYLNYVSDEYNWGRAGLTIGTTYTSKTSGTIPNAVVYPSYFLTNMSLFYEHGKNELALNVDNLFNTLYFIPDADSYVNLGALPGVGREWRITYKRKF